jgi:hypothetical protein
MYSIKDIDDIMHSEVKFIYILQEIKELIEDKTYNEFSDCIAITSLYLYKYLKINFIGNLKPKHAQKSFKSWKIRRNVWEYIFEQHGVDFNQCRKTTANFARDFKVEKALREAGYEGEIQWNLIHSLRS